MPALFDGTANQRLRNSSQRFTLAAPVSFGFEMRWPTSATSRLAFSAAPYGGDSDGLLVAKTTGNTLAFGVFDSGGYDESITSTAIANNGRTYVVGRWISNTNRRLAVQHSNGNAPDHIQNTVSRAPAGLTSWGVGWAGLTPDTDVPLGRISHFWITFADIQPGGGVLDNTLLNVLAQDGPMAVPHIRAQLIEYLPLVDSLTGDKGDYYSSRGRMSWEALNGVRLAS